jgi:hypothetical protein
MQTAFSLPETIALLSRTPSTLNTFLRGLPSRWVAANEGFDSWSAFDIVGHLVIGERTDWMAVPNASSNTAKPFLSIPSTVSLREKNAAANLSKSCSMNSLRSARKMWPRSKLSPTHFRSNDFRNIDVRRRVPVNDGVRRGFPGDLTQF